MTIRKKHVVSTVVLLVGLSSQLFAADPLYNMIADFINETILPWTRLVGAVGFIVAVSGFAWAKNNQSDHVNRWLYSIFGFLAVIALPEFINWILSDTSTQEINFN